MLAIVPVRAGSKGLPDKALRPVGGMPMILRTLRTVAELPFLEHLVVSTNDAAVGLFCRLHGYEVITRPAELATPDAPLISVAHHAAQLFEWAGDVGMFQTTCPLVTAASLAEAHTTWKRTGYDWAITAAPNDHILWQGGQALTPRANRQERIPLWQESGAAQFMTAAYLATGGGTMGILPIPSREALDVDTADDLLTARVLARRARIHFHVVGGHAVGTGHFHRSYALAQALGHHDISWRWLGDPSPQMRDHTRQWPAPDGQADISIFDCLTPSRERLRAARGRVVVLEDETEASRRYADLLVNALLDPADLPYAVIRSEFLHLPRHRVRDDANRVLLTFGGTDPTGLTRRVSAALEVLPGLEICEITPSMRVSVAAEMRRAELCITSQGGTVLEAAAAHTPCISIAANEREARHVRIPGVTYLGLHTTVTDDVIVQAVRSTLASAVLREEKAHAAAEQIDGRGLDRLVHRIEGLLL